MNNKYLFLSVLVFFTTIHPWFQPTPVQKKCTIMIHPAGDARTTGRIIQSTFERGLTLQCAEHIKHDIEFSYPHINVILTRSPREVLAPLQYASFANRLTVDLFISLHFYVEKSVKPTVFMYQFANGNEFLQPSSELHFLPYDQAHILNMEHTDKIVADFKDLMQSQRYAKLFNVHGPFKLPFKPLVGIVSPAFGIEIGLHEPKDFKTYLEALAQGLVHLVTSKGNA